MHFGARNCNNNQRALLCDRSALTFAQGPDLGGNRRNSNDPNEKKLKCLRQFVPFRSLVIFDSRLLRENVCGRTPDHPEPHFHVPKPFVCHSYKTVGRALQIFPTWNSPVYFAVPCTRD